MKQPGETFIYTKDGIEYYATIITHNINTNTYAISLLGYGDIFEVADDEVNKQTKSKK